MKSNIITIGLIFAVLAALVTLPVGVIAEGGIALIMVGILLVFLRDYRRAFKPFKRPNPILAYDAKRDAPVTLRRAYAAAGK
jgi:hypothetical protein